MANRMGKIICDCCSVLTEYPITIYSKKNKEVHYCSEKCKSKHQGREEGNDRQERNRRREQKQWS